MMKHMDDFNQMLIYLFPFFLWTIIIFAVSAVIAAIILKHSKKHNTNQSRNSFGNSTPPVQVSRRQVNSVQANVECARTTAPSTTARYNKPRFSDQDAIDALYKNIVPLKLCNSQNDGLFFEPSEAEFYCQAKSWADDNGYILLSKVREADIIHIDDLDKYRYNRIIFKALSQKHFDFVFLKQYNTSSPQYNCIPMLIVEIDGLSHETDDRKTRDQLINLLIEKYNQQIHIWRILEIIHLRRCYAGQACLWQEVKQTYDETVVGDSALPVEEILNKFLKVNERS